jgi:hypothetical protein
VTLFVAAPFKEAPSPNIRQYISLFQGILKRTKRRTGTQAVSIASGRKSATIVYKVLREKRPYIEEYKIKKNNKRESYPEIFLMLI